MLYNLLFLFIIIVLIYSYSNYPNQFSATASAIRQVWSGSCRLSCRNRASRTITDQINDQCICGSCPCDLIENVLQRCSPVTQVYSSVMYGVFAVINSAVLLLANGLHVVQCRVSCQRQIQITLKDNSTISKDVTLFKNEKSSTSSPSHDVGKTHKEEIRPPSFLKLDDVKCSTAKDTKRSSKQSSLEDKLSDSKTSVEAQAGSSRGKVVEIKDVSTHETITPKIAIQNRCYKCIEEDKMCMHECPNSKRETLNAPQEVHADKNTIKENNAVERHEEVVALPANKTIKLEKSTLLREIEERRKIPVNSKVKEEKDKDHNETVSREIEEIPKIPDNSKVKEEKYKDHNETVSLPKAETSSATVAKCPKCIEKNIACLKNCPKGTNVNKNKEPLYMPGNKHTDTLYDISQHTVGMQTEDPNQIVGNKIACCGSKTCAPGCPKTKVGQGNDLETSLDRNLNMSNEIEIPDELKKFTKCLKGTCVRNCSYPDKSKQQELAIQPDDEISSTTLMPSSQGKKSAKSKKS